MDAKRRLVSYEQQLSRILRNFTDGDMREADASRYRQIVVEIRDVLGELFPKEEYAGPMWQAYSEGDTLSGHSQHSVEEIRTFVRAAITRANKGKRRPEAIAAILNGEVTLSNIAELHWKFLSLAGGALATSFGLGMAACKLLHLGG